MVIMGVWGVKGYFAGVMGEFGERNGVFGT